MASIAQAPQLFLKVGPCLLRGGEALFDLTESLLQLPCAPSHLARLFDLRPVTVAHAEEGLCGLKRDVERPAPPGSVRVRLPGNVAARLQTPGQQRSG